MFEKLFNRKKKELNKANVLNKYNDILNKFINSKNNSKLVNKFSESIFDIKYKLEKQNRTEKEDYLLAKIYIELGHRWKAYKFIKSKIRISNDDNKLMYEKLLNRINDLFQFNNTNYKDLRDYTNNLKLVTKNLESIFDIKYKLEKKKRTEEEDYLLAQTYIDLGHRWKALKFIESKIKIHNNDDKFKFESLLKFVNYLFENNSLEYKDLRDSEIKKTSNKLNLDNLTLSEEGNSIKFKENQQIIILNKTIIQKELLEELDFSFHKSISLNQFLQILDDYFIWTNSCSSEFINHYNDNFAKIEGRFGDLPCKKADINWFNGLSIDNVTLDLDEENNLLGYYTIYDYYNLNVGFEMKTLNKSIISMIYNPDL
ncbi:hypothetical protein [Polaribacter sp. Hel1_85]|uniref:hypothetical protein n=1 Tax=Polaribacter sp. Hel1_85 TaxID=1250005 RepID=UPI00052D4F54|nr:hypothetical protein [Polaribacter sp. Hel1_85]KGL58391.1 hypothetical protein PHEL85_3450 [Polaribacter sp. Hel1_85]